MAAIWLLVGEDASQRGVLCVGLSMIEHQIKDPAVVSHRWIWRPLLRMP